VKRIVILLAVCTVPLFLFVNAWQVFRFNEALDDVRRLEERQRTLLESNKNVLVGIEVLSSPSRIDDLAAQIEAIEKKDAGSRVLVRIEAPEEEGR
jgi:low affinity Fe/Cu permease